MESIQTAWGDLRISESILFQLHRDLLRYSNKDERHRGQWKNLDNHVAAADAKGRQIGIVFQTASPFETPMLMERLLEWHAKEENDPVLHPLLRIAVFNVVFLAPPSELPNDLSPVAGRLLRLLEERQTLSVGAAAAALGVNRNTLKGKFAELTVKGYAELHGKGRGAHYRRA